MAILNWSPVASARSCCPSVCSAAPSRSFGQCELRAAWYDCDTYKTGLPTLSATTRDPVDVPSSRYTLTVNTYSRARTQLRLDKSLQHGSISPCAVPSDARNVELSLWQTSISWHRLVTLQLCSFPNNTFAVFTIMLHAPCCGASWAKEAGIDNNDLAQDSRLLRSVYWLLRTPDESFKRHVDQRQVCNRR